MGRDSEGLRDAGPLQRSSRAPGGAGKHPGQRWSSTSPRICHNLGAEQLGSGRAVVLPDMAIRVYRRRGADAGDVVHLGGGSAAASLRRKETRN
jgi:hypothetical protein